MKTILSCAIGLLAVGCAHYPLGDNKTAEGRANNRRVEIVVTPATPRGG